MINLYNENHILRKKKIPEMFILIPNVGLGTYNLIEEVINFITNNA